METPLQCGLCCRSSNVLSVCLRNVLNINRAEKCPEWNELVAAWSLSFVMMVISAGEEGGALLCCTAESRWLCLLLPYSTRSKRLICAGTWLGAWVLTSWPRSSWDRLMNASRITLTSRHITLWSLYCKQMIISGTHWVYCNVQLDMQSSTNPLTSCVTVFTDCDGRVKNTPQRRLPTDNSYAHSVPPWE